MILLTCSVVPALSSSEFQPMKYYLLGPDIFSSPDKSGVCFRNPDNFRTASPFASSAEGIIPMCHICLTEDITTNETDGFSCPSHILDLENWTCSIISAPAHQDKLHYSWTSSMDDRVLRANAKAKPLGHAFVDPICINEVE